MNLRRGSCREIAFLLNGGLGNQLFQLSGAVAICRLTGRAGVMIPVGYAVEDDLNVELSLKRRPEIGRVLEEIEYLRLGEGGQEQFRRPFLISKSLARLGLGALGTSIVETGCRDQQWNQASRRTLRVRGFFRSSRVVREAWEVLKDPIIRALPVASPKPCDDSMCVVHLRLGDYMTDPTTRQVHGGITSPSYLNQALIVANAARVVSVVSDQPFQAREYLANVGIESVPLGTSADSPWSVLGSLANARCLVGSNSTLSWWGAWIGQYMGQSTSVLPARWFRDGAGVCEPHFDFPGLIRI